MVRTAIRHLSIALLIALGAADAHGQFGERVRRLLNGDSLAPPDHDTAYVTTYRNNLVVSVLSKYQFMDIGLEREDGAALSYTTNGNEQYGVGLNLKWLAVEATFNVPAFNQHDASLGPTRSRGFGLGYTGRRLWARGFWSHAQGFHMEEPGRWAAGWTEGDAPITRPDLRSDTYLLSVNYALSRKRRFSQNAALFQMERQKRSAGTWVAGLSAWAGNVQADSSLVSQALQDTFLIATGFTRVDRSIVGATFGYTHTFAFWGKGFIHVAVLPGVAYVHQRIAPTEGAGITGQGAASVTEFKLGAGFNGDRWYGALATAYYYGTVGIAEELNMSTNHGFVRLALGVRLGAPRSGALQKVGL